MKILHTVEFYTPSVGGAQEVVKQLSEHLVRLGHDVYVATTKIPGRQKKVINGVKIIEFEVSGNAVRGYEGSDIQKYKNFLVNGNFDIMMNYAAQQWTADLAFEVIDHIKAKKILVPCGFSGLYEPSYSSYFKKIPKILSQYNATIYLSSDYRDINFAKQHRISNIFIIPNGADEREFAVVNNQDVELFRQKLGIQAKNNLIISVGNHTGLKGHSESIRVFQQSNLKNSTLMIIGDINWDGGCYKGCLRKAWFYNNVTSKLLANNNHIAIASLTRNDTLLAFHAADVFLFLSNIECSPLVLFEAAASGTPFIASSAGNSREIARWTGSGLIAKSKIGKGGSVVVDIKNATKLLKKVLDDKNLCERMSKSGKKSWKGKFTWEKIAKEYEKLYEKC